MRTPRNGSEVFAEKTTTTTQRKNVEVKRPTTLPTNGEAFRQRMYDEYVHKVLERQERKSHKVVKLSSHEDIKRKADGDMSAMAREFIEKARSRLSKFGINLDESGTERDEDEDGDALISAKFLIDGKELQDVRKLPKHLREFLKISTMSDDEGGGELRRMEWTMDFAVLLVVLLDDDWCRLMAAERERERECPARRSNDPSWTLGVPRRDAL